MPSKIKLLDPTVASQIAAGEVIERPASVVKELVENALDAGATRVEVEIEEGGKRLIRVTDNGCGMSSEDAVLCLQRHATSKIRTAEDLHSLQTLGFRGEALPSIAAVSHLTLQTRASDQDSGVELRVEGGTVVDFRKVGCPPGTTVIVQRLFFNIPARLKFLKATNTERNHVLETLRRFALRYLGVGFGLIHGNQELLRVPAGEHLKERLAPLLGRELAREMIPVELEAGDLKVSGSIGKPSISRANREHQVFFVNGHVVRDRRLRLALYEGYHTLLVKDRHPVAILWIDVDPGQVDVNVHPTKSEVRFSNQVEMHRLLARAVREALEQASLFGGESRIEGKPTAPPAVPPTPRSEPTLPFLKTTPSPFPPGAQAAEGQREVEEEELAREKPEEETREQVPREEDSEPRETRARPLPEQPPSTLPGKGSQAPMARDYSAGVRSYPQPPSAEDRPVAPIRKRKTPTSRDHETASPLSPPPHPSRGPSTPTPVRPETTPAEREAFRQALRQRFAGPPETLEPSGWSPFLRFFGQLLGRYFLAETEAGFVLIDQHQAHRQILCAQWQEWRKRRRIPVVRRNPPVAVDVPKKTVKLLQEERTLVQSLGLDLEPFGGTAFLVRTVPEVADHVPAQDLVVAVVMALVDASDQPPEQRPLRVIEALAQKCALPAGQILDPKAQADFEALIQAWLPILDQSKTALAEITLSHLEKMFQRR